MAFPCDQPTAYPYRGLILMTIGIGSDHFGLHLKNHIFGQLRDRRETVRDFGTFDESPVDYPDIAVRVIDALQAGSIQRGILICRTGLGMAIAANKAPGVYAAAVCDVDTARLARQSNGVQVLTLGASIVGQDAALAIVDAWLGAEFLGGRSERKLEKIRLLEARYSLLEAVRHDVAS